MEQTTDTTICNLVMRVGPARFEAAVYTAVGEGEFRLFSFPLGLSGRAPLDAIQEAVYDTPLLLSDFRRSFCIIETPHILITPSEIPEADAARLFALQWPEAKGRVRHTGIGVSNARMTYAIDPGLEGFFSRTFSPEMQVEPALAPLVKYLSTRSGRGSSARMVCNLRPESLDLIVLQGSHLRMANTFRYDKPMDAFYYIMASRKSLGLDPATDEMYLTGTQHVREQLSPMLQRYIARVMPVIFPPQMFNAGREALTAPFDMIVTPICE